MKRTLDVIAASVLLLLFSPIMLLTALAVRLAHGKPVLFKQIRPGLHEQLFAIYKFRTMTSDVDSNDQLLPDRDRITRVGLFLRATSLDELPQLLNVLRGEMSLVGPRPLLVKYLPCYSDRERLRFQVRPGITGLAQVSGRNEISWDKRLELDAQYVERISLLYDLHLLWKTIVKVLRRDGIADVSVTVEQDLDVERYRKQEEVSTSY